MLKTIFESGPGTKIDDKIRGISLFYCITMIAQFIARKHSIKSNSFQKNLKLANTSVRRSVFITVIVFNF